MSSEFLFILAITNDSEISIQPHGLSFGVGGKAIHVRIVILILTILDQYIKFKNRFKKIIIFPPLVCPQRLLYTAPQQAVLLSC